MDRLDISIVREMAQEGMVLPARSGTEPSYREIARKLGQSPSTVRNRIKSMYEARVLLGSSVYPNPNLLDLLVYSYAIDISPSLSKQTVISKLKSLVGMQFIHNFHGTLLGLVFLTKDEKTSREMISNINAITGTTNGMSSRVLYPPCISNLSEEELALVKRLASGSFESYQELAKELRTSLRTVKRRISKVTLGRVILSVPTMDYRQIKGAAADLIVTYVSQGAKSKTEMKILERVNDYTIFAGMWEDISMYSMVIPQVSVATEIVESVKRMEGVKSARLEYVEEQIDLVKTLSNFVS